MFYICSMGGLRPRMKCKEPCNYKSVTQQFLTCQFEQTVKWGSSLVNPHVRWKEAAMLWHTNIFIIHTFVVVTCHWVMKTQAYEIRVDVVKLCILWVLSSVIISTESKSMSGSKAWLYSVSICMFYIWVLVGSATEMSFVCGKGRCSFCFSHSMFV